VYRPGNSYFVELRYFSISSEVNLNSLNAAEVALLGNSNSFDSPQ
jgi:hypothetical protein